MLEPEYLVKYVGRSHHHNEWVAESVLMQLARRKLVNFKRRHGAAPCNLLDPAWKVKWVCWVLHCLCQVACLALSA